VTKTERNLIRSQIAINKAQAALIKAQTKSVKKGN